MPSLLPRPARRWFFASLSGALALPIAWCLLGIEEAGGAKTLGQATESGGDIFFVAAMIRGLARGDWNPFGLARFPHLGAPFGSTLADFPMADRLHFVALRLLASFTGNPFTLYNLYFLLGFALAAASMTLALQKLRVGSATAIAAGLVYSFLPFHFYRYGHLFLASYYLLPWLAVWLLRFPRGLERGRRARLALFALLLGSAGVYYAFFACFLFVVAGALAWRQRGDRRALLSAGVAVALISASVGINLLPELAYRLRHGPNTVYGDRSPLDAEVNGLKLSHVLLPPPDHRFKAYAKLRWRIDSPEEVEGKYEYLGLFAIFGLALAARELASRGRRSRTRRIFGWLSLALFLFCSSGGFGPVFNTLITSKIRAYDRASILLATFGIILAASWLDRRLRRLPPLAAGPLLLLVTAAAIADQSAPSMKLPLTPALAAETSSDRDFFARVDARLGPEGPSAVVLQLPVMVFPEAGSVEGSRSYSHLRAYLWSESDAAWSYGAMRGRPGWQALDGIDSPVDWPRIRRLGFTAVLVDRAGYADRAQALERALRSRASPPLESANGRLAFYLLQP